jgi:ABC-type iron transport system FetAB ATPase subunit
MNSADEMLTELISKLEEIEKQSFDKGAHEYGAGIQFALIWIKHAKATIKRNDKQMEEQK